MSRRSGPAIRVSAAALPDVKIAGRFPMGDNSRGIVYRGRTHVIHQHDYHATLRLGDRRIQIEPGDFTLTPAGIDSSYDLPRNGTHLCVHFLPEQLSKPAHRVPLHWRPGVHSHVLADRFSRVIDYFRRAQNTRTTAQLAAAVASSAVQELLAWVAFASASADSMRGDSRVQPALSHLVKLLEERCGEAWTIPALAAETGLSQNYLAHHFRKRMGITIQRYLLNRRIELAKHLLVTTRMPIKQIGVTVGMPDPQHFNKQFRHLTGMSPSAARESAGMR